MITLKLIKAKSFDTNGTTGTAYTCAYKGRVLNVSSLAFADEEADCLVADLTAKTLVINTAIEIVVRPYVDYITGDILKGLSVLPKSGLTIAEF